MLGHMHMLLNALLHVAVLALTIFGLSRLHNGIYLKTPTTSVVVAVVFSLLNLFLGWFLRALLVVPTILSLGLLLLFSSFIINTALLWLTDRILDSFELKSTRALFYSSGAITLVNWLLHMQLRHWA
jgi:putative membrane protein